MKMLISVSWRNIWRHPARSGVIIVAIVLGLMGGNFISAVSTGLLQQSFRETIEGQVSHIQLHNPDFVGYPEARHNVDSGQDIAEKVRAREDVKAVSARLAFDGMAASASMSTWVRILGVRPEREEETTGMSERLSKGSFFSKPGRLPSAAIGEALAEKLNIDLGSRFVLTFQDIGGELVSASFRVEGIFSMASKSFEERMLYVKADELGNLAGKENIVTEIAVLLYDGEKYREVTDKLRSLFPQLEVRNWEELAPMLYMQQRILENSLGWVTGIILLGVAFGILNTILMSVLERTRELGMLMAVGMKRIKVFFMVIIETVMLSLTGGIAGLTLSFFMVRHMGKRGIDLSVIGGEHLHEMGFSPEIYPALETTFYMNVALMVVIFAVTAAVYPAFRATRLVPAEAVRKE